MNMDLHYHSHGVKPSRIKGASGKGCGKEMERRKGKKRRVCEGRGGGEEREGHPHQSLCFGLKSPFKTTPVYVPGFNIKLTQLSSELRR